MVNHTQEMEWNDVLKQLYPTNVSFINLKMNCFHYMRGQQMYVMKAEQPCYLKKQLVVSKTKAFLNKLNNLLLASTKHQSKKLLQLLDTVT